MVWASLSRAERPTSQAPYSVRPSRSFRSTLATRESEWRQSSLRYANVNLLARYGYCNHGRLDSYLYQGVVHSRVYRDPWGTHYYYDARAWPAASWSH